MYTSSAIRKIGLFDMSRPRASFVWVCKTGITIVIRDHLGFPYVSKLLDSLVFPSRYGSDSRAIGRASRR